MTLFVVVALALAGVGVYCAYKDPKLGAALLVGIAILTVLWLVVERDTPSSFPSATEPVPPRAPS